MGDIDRKARLAQSFPAEAMRLPHMAGIELEVVIAALSTGIDGLCGVYNQPRCDANSVGGKWIAKEMDRLGGLREMFILEMKHREPTGNPDEDEEAIRIVSSYEMLDCGSDIAEVMEWMIGRKRKADEAARNTRRAA